MAFTGNNGAIFEERARSTYVLLSNNVRLMTRAAAAGFLVGKHMDGIDSDLLAIQKQVACLCHPSLTLASPGSSARSARRGPSNSNGASCVFGPILIDARAFCATMASISPHVRPRGFQAYGRAAVKGPGLCAMIVVRKKVAEALGPLSITV